MLRTHPTPSPRPQTPPTSSSQPILVRASNNRKRRRQSPAAFPFLPLYMLPSLAGGAFALLLGDSVYVDDPLHRPFDYEVVRRPDGIIYILIQMIQIFGGPVHTQIFGGAVIELTAVPHPPSAPPHGGRTAAAHTTQALSARQRPPHCGSPTERAPARGTD